MKNLKITLVTLIGIFILSNFAFSQKVDYEILKNKDVNFYELQSERKKDFDAIAPQDRRGFKQFSRWEYFWEQRTFPTGEFPDANKILDEFNHFNVKYSKESNSTLSNTWTSLGPGDKPEPLGVMQGIGRVNVLKVHPDNHDELWIGAATGGLWRSIDAGSTWQIFPYTQFLSLGVTDIAIAPSKPEVVYVNTGDLFASTSSANYYSIGMIKTTNSGQTWETTSLHTQISDRRLLSRILVHPEDHNTLITGGSSGVFKSTNGGETWYQPFSESFIIDLEFKPDNHNVIYASSFSWAGNVGIWKSEDMGESFQKMYNVPAGVRIELAVSRAEPDMVYAIVANRSNNGFESFLISEDAGDNWMVLSNRQSVGNILGWYLGTSNDQSGQGFYDLCIAINPLKAEDVFVGGINLWKSNSYGSAFELNTHWFGAFSKPFVHADHHNLTFSPDGKTLYSAHDGGIDKTTDLGKNWTSISDGLVITQFYRLGASNHHAQSMVGGSQDNGTSLLDSDGIWRKILGSDGMECIIDYSDPKILYASTYNGNIFISYDGGVSFSEIISSNGVTQEAGAWVTPFIQDPNYPHILYAGYRNIWKSNNRGNNWYKITTFPSSHPTFSALAVAPSNSNFIYGATPAVLYKSSDGGATFNVILTTQSAITSIEVDPNNPERIWVTHSGFNSELKIQEYDGNQWKNITGNLPNVPANSVVYQTDSPDRLYIGTDLGVFYSDYNSAYWELYGSELPNVVVSEIQIVDKFNVISAATYGRGMWQAPLNTCNVPQPRIDVIGKTSFCSNETTILRSVDEYPNYLWSNGETTREIEVSKTGAYSLIIESQDGCSAKSSAIFIEVKPVNSLVVTFDGAEAICNDEPVVLNALFGFQNYSWSNGMEGRRITVTEPGDYYVTARAANGCEVTSEIMTVIEADAPEIPVVERYLWTLIAPDADSYQWYYEGKEISGATDKYYEFNEDKYGNYQVEVFNQFGCSQISENYSAFTSVKDELASKIAVYPNPGTGVYNVSLPDEIHAVSSIELADITGKRLRNLSINTLSNSKDFSFDISDMPNGSYRLIIHYGDNSISLNVIKQ